MKSAIAPYMRPCMFHSVSSVVVYTRVTPAGSVSIALSLRRKTSWLSLRQEGINDEELEFGFEID